MPELQEVKVVIDSESQSMSAKSSPTCGAMQQQHETREERRSSVVMFELTGGSVDMRTRDTV